MVAAVVALLVVLLSVSVHSMCLAGDRCCHRASYQRGTRSGLGIGLANFAALVAYLWRCLCPLYAMLQGQLAEGGLEGSGFSFAASFAIILNVDTIICKSLGYYCCQSTCALQRQGGVRFQELDQVMGDGNKMDLVWESFERVGGVADVETFLPSMSRCGGSVLCSSRESLCELQCGFHPVLEFCMEVSNKNVMNVLSNQHCTQVAPRRMGIQMVRYLGQHGLVLVL